MSDNDQLLESIDKAALDELARTILSELTKYESSRRGDRAASFGDNMRRKRSSSFETESGETAKMSSDYGAEGTYAPFFRNDGADEYAPLRSRRDLLGQRIERRKSRSLQKSGDAAYITAAINGIPERPTEASDPTQCRQAEKLSELFCRDARRYDGAFERY